MFGAIQVQRVAVYLAYPHKFGFGGVLGVLNQRFMVVISIGLYTSALRIMFMICMELKARDLYNVQPHITFSSGLQNCRNTYFPFRTDTADFTSNSCDNHSFVQHSRMYLCRMYMCRMSTCRMSICQMHMCRMFMCRMSMCRMSLCRVSLRRTSLCRVSLCRMANSYQTCTMSKP